MYLLNEQWLEVSNEKGKLKENMREIKKRNLIIEIKEQNWWIEEQGNKWKLTNDSLYYEISKSLVDILEHIPIINSSKLDNVPNKEYMNRLRELGALKLENNFIFINEIDIGNDKYYKVKVCYNEPVEGKLTHTIDLFIIEYLNEKGEIKMAYYGVKEGRKPGVYDNWKDAQAQTSRYPNAKFKKFETKEEAFLYVEGSESIEKINTKNLKEGKAIAYVDGSFCDINNVYGYGILLIDENGYKFEFKGYGDNEEFLKSRNVSGEIMGAMYAIQHAMEKGIKHIFIHHDYQGIASWALGDWKANTPIAQYYKEYYDNVINYGLNVEFVKVKAHSGDYYNDKVDELAKQGTQMARG